MGVGIMKYLCLAVQTAVGTGTSSTNKIRGINVVPYPHRYQEEHPDYFEFSRPPAVGRTKLMYSFPSYAIRERRQPVYQFYYRYHSDYSPVGAGGERTRSFHGIPALITSGSNAWLPRAVFLWAEVEPIPENTSNRYVPRYQVPLAYNFDFSGTPEEDRWVSQDKSYPLTQLTAGISNFNDPLTHFVLILETAGGSWSGTKGPLELSIFGTMETEPTPYLAYQTTLPKIGKEIPGREQSSHYLYFFDIGIPFIPSKLHSVQIRNKSDDMWWGASSCFLFGFHYTERKGRLLADFGGRLISQDPYDPISVGRPHLAEPYLIGYIQEYPDWLIA